MREQCIGAYCMQYVDGVYLLGFGLRFIAFVHIMDDHEKRLHTFLRHH